MHNISGNSNRREMMLIINYNQQVLGISQPDRCARPCSNTEQTTDLNITRSEQDQTMMAWQGREHVDVVLDLMCCYVKYMYVTCYNIILWITATVIFVVDKFMETHTEKK